MERLTEHSKQTSHENGICCTHFCGPECLEVGGNCAMNCKWEEAAWSRLAAYEDTGLSPDEILPKEKADEIALKLMRLADLESFAPYDRLRELAESDSEGRSPVLHQARAAELVLCGGNVMGRLWDYCAFCGKRIETGEKCYGLPNGESVCTDCCVAENEGAAVSDGEEEQEG